MNRNESAQSIYCNFELTLMPLCFGTFTWSRQSMKTSAPLLERSLAVSAPIPEFPPVKTTVLPCRLLLLPVPGMSKKRHFKFKLSILEGTITLSQRGVGY